MENVIDTLLSLSVSNATLLQSVLTFRFAPAHKFCWMPSAALATPTNESGIIAVKATEMVSNIFRSILFLISLLNGLSPLPTRANPIIWARQQSQAHYAYRIVFWHRQHYCVHQRYVFKDQR